ncbi:bilin biosynthesis protein CpeY [Cyanobium sp.]|nr:bilin biosynthesis protein CpeY [Cyanobium sp.]
MVSMQHSNTSYDNIHPGLSQADALAILEAPLGELDAASDYYMAAAHLLNFPGAASEAALLRLVNNTAPEQPVQLARRKAVEVLGRFGCQKAIPSIGRCLESSDPYLVENAAWALQQLNCQDATIHQALCKHLHNHGQSRRVLIQSLAGLGVQEALPAIQALQSCDNPGVRGTALAAVARLSGDRSRLQELEDHLTLPNQMDRQTAIQDLIDCGGCELLPSILRAPVSPVFRMRALRALWPAGAQQHAGLELLACLDTLLTDPPEQLVLVHRYDTEPSVAFLLGEFFGTDFSRSYLAWATLQQRDATEIWPALWQRWQEDAHNDYGAHYFVIQLLGSMDGWPQQAEAAIEQVLLGALRSTRPQFSKSKPAACLALHRRAPHAWASGVGEWLSPRATRNWELRYAACMGLTSAHQAGSLPEAGWREILNESEPDGFVAAKRQLLISA